MSDDKIAELCLVLKPLRKESDRLHEQYTNRLDIDQPLRKQAAIALDEFKKSPTLVKRQNYRRAKVTLYLSLRKTRDVDHQRWVAMAETRAVSDQIKALRVA
jgi:hypothetical protein